MIADHFVTPTHGPGRHLSSETKGGAVGTIRRAIARSKETAVTPDCAVCDRPITNPDDCEATHMDPDGHLVHAFPCCPCNNPRNERGARRTLPNLPKEAA